MQLCWAGFPGGCRVTAFHVRFTALRVSRCRGACASLRHLEERNYTSTSPKLSKTLRSRPFISDTYGHFEGTDRSFPMYLAFPGSEDSDASDASRRPWWTAHLRIRPEASHVHTVGLDRDQVDGDFSLTHPLFAVPDWRAGSLSSLPPPWGLVAMTPPWQDESLPDGHRLQSLSRQSWTLLQAMQDITGEGLYFPKVFHPFVYSSCDLSAKPDCLAACIAPHRYLSGAALSPLGCIPQTLRPNGSGPAEDRLRTYVIPTLRFVAHR